MSGKFRYVFDTNTLVSALLFEHSKPDRAFRQALKLGEVLVSSSTLEELADVLKRKKFDRYVTPDERDEFLEALVARAIFIDPSEKLQECRDPKDDKFLELAVSGKARRIISGDDDLLVLNPFRDIVVQTPEDFLKSFEEDMPDEAA